MTPSDAPARPSRFATFNAFVDGGHAHLRKLGCGSAAALWFILWRFVNTDTDSVRVSAGTLAECFGTDRRNIQRMLAQLEEHGYLTTLSKGSKGRGACATYRLSVPLEYASPLRIYQDGKGVTMTHISPENKCVTETHFEPENASW